LFPSIGSDKSALYSNHFGRRLCCQSPTSQLIYGRSKLWVPHAMSLSLRPIQQAARTYRASWWLYWYDIRSSFQRRWVAPFRSPLSHSWRQPPPPPLFLWSYEIINSKCDLLHFRAFIHVAEVHDFNPPSDSDVDGLANGDDDSSEEDYPGYMSDPRILRHWPS
jgi:hypothetical protein